MLSWKQAQEMTRTETVNANNKLVAKIVLFKIVLPIAIIVAVDVAVRYMDKND